MLKMFSTQLTGLLNRIHEKEEFSFEDGARLMAQAAVSEGSIYIYGKNEMNAVLSEALYGPEPLQNAKHWDGQSINLTEGDRVLIFTRYSHDKEALAAGNWLFERKIPFVSISTDLGTEEDTIVSLADVHIDLQLKKGLLPDENGNRFGYPSSIAALFVYYGLKFTLDEILTDY